MDNSVKISVVIPVYNAEKYLPICLDHLLAQTLPEIEIICVDDCSKDNSLEVLRKYQAKDNRVKVIALPVPSSALVARKRGVEAAKGEYIWFNDSDDYVDTDACRLLYEKIKEKKVEILHFRNAVCASKIVTEERLELNRRLTEPYYGRLEGNDVFNACFAEQKYFIQLWNKLFDANLCKKAFRNIEDTYMPKAQDLYTYFVISHYAKSYYGWESQPLYFYYLGNGYTGRLKNDLDTFSRYCDQYKVIDAMEAFALQEGFVEETQEIIDGQRNKFLREIINMWLTFQGAEAETAGKLLFDSWNVKYILEALTKDFWYRRGYIAKKIQESNVLSCEKKPVKTVALYYMHFNVGGVQRVMSLIIRGLVEKGYKVILITDKEPSEFDFVVDCPYEREIIPGDVIKEQYIIRAKALEQVVHKYHIDIVLYQAWVSPMLLWDMMLLQANNVPVIVQSHNVFSHPLTSGNNKKFGDYPYVLALANGITTLSDVDREFWSVFNGNVKWMPNPVDPMLQKCDRIDGKNKIVLWTARFSGEKNLYGALCIMKNIVKFDPEIKLWVVGDSASADGVEVNRKKAQKMGIQDNVVFWGFQSDMGKFYSQAAVNLMTSRYEGYPMVLVEAKAHGLPSVIYEMPYLALAAEGKGTISVRQGDTVAAAKELVSLLNDRVLWQEKSNESYQAFRELADFQYFDELVEMFDHIDEKADIHSSERRMIDTILTHAAMSQGANIGNGKQTRHKSSSLFGKLSGGIQCVRDHGFVYTVKYAFVKMFRKFGIHVEFEEE